MSDDRLITLARSMAKSHRVLAEHNEQGTEGWRQSVQTLAANTHSIADDFEAIADRLVDYQHYRTALLEILDIAEHADDPEHGLRICGHIARGQVG